MQCIPKFESCPSTEIPQGVAEQDNAAWYHWLMYSWVRPLLNRGLTRLHDGQMMASSDLLNLPVYEDPINNARILQKYWDEEVEGFNKSVEEYEAIHGPIDPIKPKEKKEERDEGSINKNSNAPDSEMKFVNKKKDSPSSGVSSPNSRGPPGAAEAVEEEVWPVALPSLPRALRRAFWRRIALGGAFRFISDASSFSFPFLLREFIKWMNEADGEVYVGFMWVIGIVGINILMSSCLNAAGHHTTTGFTRMTTALPILIYDKVLTLPPDHGITGHLTTLHASDSQRFAMLSMMFHACWASPLLLIGAVIALYIFLGVAGIIAIIVLVLTSPVQAILMSKLMGFRQQVVRVQDRRLAAVNEALQGIRIAKFMCWEERFEERIRAIRAEEVSVMRSAQIYKTIVFFIAGLIPALTIIGVFILFYYIDGDVTTERVIPAMSMLNVIRMPVVQLPMSFVAMIDTSVALGRIQKFFMRPGITAYIQTDDEDGKNSGDASMALSMEDISILPPLSGDVPILQNISCYIKKGDFSIIHGPTGCGKSTLVKCLIGEARLTKDSGAVKCSGSVAYVSQEAWIMNATVQANILMGLPMDEDMYKRVVDACQLRDDYKRKQQQADEADEADSSTSTDLTTDATPGSVALPRTEDSPHQREPTANTTTTAVTTTATSTQQVQPLPTKTPPKAKSLMSKEGTVVGGVPWRVYGWYAGLGTTRWAILTITIGVLWRTSVVFGDLWLSWWSGKVQIFNQSYTGTEYMTYFAICVGVGVIFNGVWQLFLAFFVLEVSKNSHHSMVRRVLRAPTSFFDTTPMGRILNRFSKDMDNIDTAISESLRQILNTSLLLCGTISIVIYTSPFILVIVPFLLLILRTSYNTYVTTVRNLKQLTATTRSPMMSVLSETLGGLSTIRAYSMANHFRTTHVVRAQVAAVPPYCGRCCQRWLSFQTESVSNIALFVVVYMGALIATIGDGGLGITVPVISLAIAYVTATTNAVTNLTRTSAEIAANMSSTERVREYSTDIPIERDVIYSKDIGGTQNHHPHHHDVAPPRPPTSWPESGAIVMKDVKLRYRPELELVLKGVNFTIPGGCKVGIVGRTGSGKSTIILSIFRMIELAGGSISIDGFDIANVSLHDLRSSITIIPQDPVLFTGTLRSNVDPFNEQSEEEIWNVLEKCRMRTRIEDGGGLDSHVEERGGNFSVGQRQLLCLARAMLKSCKVLLLDEATASVDFEVDALIQETIRTEFKGCTVLTIAHRLETIIDADKVIVMSNGYVDEFGSPDTLLNGLGDNNNTSTTTNEEDIVSGSFKGMVNALGDVKSSALKIRARDVAAAAHLGSHK